MKRKVMVGIIVLAIIVTIVAFIGAFVLIRRSNEYEKAKNYLLALPQNDKCAYATSRNVYIEGKLVEGSSELKNGDNVLLIDKDYIYYESENEDYTTKIIRTNHSFTNAEVVFESEELICGVYVAPGGVVIYVLYTQTGSETHAYNISTGEDTVYEDMESYQVEKLIRDAHNNYQFNLTNPGEEYKNFQLTDKNGQSKQIDESHLEALRNDPCARYVEEATGKALDLWGIDISGDKIFVRLVSEEKPISEKVLCLVYSYDFETEEYTFFDWIELKYDEQFFSDFYYIGE